MSTNDKGIFYIVPDDAPITEEARSLALADSVPVGRNYLINGAFEVNQRSFSSTSSSLVFTYDRWMTEGASAGGSITWSSQALSPGSIEPNLPTMGKILRIVTASLGTSNYALISQKIEDARLLAGKTVTVSWWAKAGSGSPYMQVVLQSNYGSGGSPDTRNQSPAIQLSTSWARYSYTFTVPSASGKTVGANSWTMPYFLVSDGVIFNTLGAQNNTFDFWGMQLEEGSYATPFRRNAPSIQAELAACQRYFQALGAGTTGQYYSGSTLVECGITFPVVMRAAPTLTHAGNYTVLDIGVAVRTASGTSLTVAGPTGAQIMLSGVGGTNGNQHVVRETTNIWFSAEL